MMLCSAWVALVLLMAPSTFAHARSLSGLGIGATADLVRHALGEIPNLGLLKNRPAGLVLQPSFAVGPFVQTRTFVTPATTAIPTTYVQQAPVVAAQVVVAPRPQLFVAQQPYVVAPQAATVVAGAAATQAGASSSHPLSQAASMLQGAVGKVQDAAKQAWQGAMDNLPTMPDQIILPSLPSRSFTLPGVKLPELPERTFTLPGVQGPSVVLPKPTFSKQ